MQYTDHINFITQEQVFQRMYKQQPWSENEFKSHKQNRKAAKDKKCLKCKVYYA